VKDEKKMDLQHQVR